ncbi:MAG TPA: polyprenyl diphosphate synthase, partial [Rhodothermales bacterium]
MSEASTTASIDAADASAQKALTERGPLPVHIAMIMDGNGRWARERGESRIVGHHEGVESVRDITEACAELGIPFLTLYTFSTENWERPDTEVEALMRLLIHTIRRERETLKKNNIRLLAIGDLECLPTETLAELRRTIEETAGNTRMTLTMAISYSGRWEIARAAREIARRVEEGSLRAEDVDEALIERTLTTSGVPDPDLLVRTGGEMRVSNFLLWQIAYTEIYITETYWPAFRRVQLYEAIRDFQDRDR